MRSNCSGVATGPDGGVIVGGIAEHRLVGDGHDVGHQLVVNRRVHDGAGSCEARLSTRREHARGDALRRPIEIRVVEHDLGRLPAELERHRLEVASSQLGHHPAGGGASGERDLLHQWMLDECRDHLRTEPSHHVDDAGREAGPLDEPHEREDRRGRCSDGLTTTVFPAASAGASFHAASRSGEFHGSTAATTPYGS